VYGACSSELNNVQLFLDRFYIIEEIEYKVAA